jgi:hypothetical protein
MKPKCRWCGGPLAPAYKRLCIDCGHEVFWHAQPNQAASVKRNCTPSMTICECTKPNPGWGGTTPEEGAYRDNYQNQQFPKKLIGYGKDAQGMFCTLNCALRWAHYFAPLISGMTFEQVRDVLERERKAKHEATPADAR